MNTANENFEVEGLTIKVTYTDDAANIAWYGTSEIQSPEMSLGPFIKDLIPHLVGKKVTMDFRQFEYMNSATLQPLLQLIKELSTNSIDTQLLYNANMEWQRITFRCIKAITRTLQHINVSNT